jgi:FkbM family methyltransferase
MNLDKFDWGPTSEKFKIQVIKEIFNGTNDYEKLFEVEEDDIVVDIGATVGEFTYKILEKKPKHCYVVEPLPVFFDTLKRNLEGHQVSFTNAAITGDKYCEINWDGYNEKVNTLTFKEFVELNRLKKIDFLKFDCEGGEYDIFSSENIEYLKLVPKIVCEMHLRTGLLKEKFRYFRDKVLPNFKNFQFMSLDGVNITWDLKNEHFIEYYKEVYLYIKN